MIHEEGSFRSMAEHLDAVAEWIESYGVVLNPSGRLLMYHRHLHAIANANDAGPDALAELWKQEGGEVLANSVVEAFEWIDIGSALGDRRDAGLTAKLRLAVKGNPSYRDERADSSAHDYQFELALAARLHRGRVGEVQFEEKGDFLFDYRGRQLIFECKQIASERQINRRFRKAHSQLEQRYVATKLHASGLIGMSVTRLLNPDTARPAFTSWAALDTHLRAMMGRFVEQNEHLWLRPTDERTLGAVIRFRGAAYVDGDGRDPFFAPAECVTLSFRQDLAPADEALMFSFAADLDRVRPGHLAAVDRG